MWRLEGARGAYRLIAPVAQIELPATVQAVLAARIDRLPEREKRLLRTASVIGKELPEPLLRRVAELAHDRGRDPGVSGRGPTRRGGDGAGAADRGGG